MPGMFDLGSELEADTEGRVEELSGQWEPDSEDDISELYSDTGDESGEAEINALFQSLRETFTSVSESSI